MVKILVGLVTVISVLGLFAIAVIQLSNQVRFEHYWTEFVSPPLSFLAKYDTNIVVDKKVGVSQVSKKELMLSNLNMTRLTAQQVVIDINDDELLAWTLSSSDELLQFKSSLNDTKIYRLYLELIVEVLNASTEVPLNIRIKNIAGQLNVGIDRVLDESEHQNLKVENTHVVRSKGAVSGAFRLENNQVFKVIFPTAYSSFSWPIFLFLLVFMLGLFALVSYQLIQSLERRLRNIETAASRISRGELDARVSKAGDEDSISRLGTAFNSMADHIQRLMLVQKEMIHAVSHELRTPVARIRFGVQMIEDCPGQEELAKQVRGIDGDIQELDELIDEILTYARLEQGGPILAFQEADVSAIVEQVVSEQGSVKPEMSIFSEYKKGSDVWKISEVEARYIHRSIQNLVGNATRYANSKVCVVCSFDSETCRIDVEDDGPGIPESDWESVFTPFARLDDSRTRSSGGYGLGLSIVRRILYWHGGQAFLGRSHMGGAKFSLVWPRKQAKH